MKEIDKIGSPCTTDIVRILEEALALARAGEIKTICIIHRTTDNKVAYPMAGHHSNSEMVGAIEIAKTAIIMNSFMGES
jgi:hypothetical protein